MTDIAQDIAINFEKGLRNLARLYEEVRRREDDEPPRPQPPFEHPIALLEGAWEPIRKLHPIFTWPTMTAEGREPSKWQWSRTVDALKAAGFVQRGRPFSKPGPDRVVWFNVPPDLFAAFHEANPESDVLGITPNRTRPRTPDNTNQAISDACKVWVWAYLKGIVAHPDKDDE